MALALRPGETFDYVLQADRSLPPEQQTVWLLHALSASDHAKLIDKLGQAKDGAYQVTVGSNNIEALRAGLGGWRNFRDANGNEIEFKTWKTGCLGRTRDCPTDLMLDYIRPGDRAELADAIKGNSELTETDAKN